MESSEIPIQEQTSGGGFLSNKRNLLILAAVLGGGAGLVLFLARRQSGGSSASGGAPVDQTQLQLGNIANQLLQFRGDVSLSNAGIQQSLDSQTQAINEGNANLETSVANGLAANKSDLMGFLGTNFDQILYNLGIVTNLGVENAQYSDAILSNQRYYNPMFQQALSNIGTNQQANQAALTSLFGSLFDSLGNVSTQVQNGQQLTADAYNMQRENIAAVLGAILKANGPYVPAGYSIGLVPGYTQPSLPANQLYAHQAPTGGAGGFSAIEFVPSIHDAGDGSASDWTALMSAGPVRRIA